MATVTVELPDRLAEFVREQVARGDYGDDSAVVSDAIRQLRERKAEYDRRMEILRQEVEKGLADVRAGRFSTKSVEEIFDDVMREEYGE
ncbi:hypothetical protein C882_0123 [Caenispirillum salinarum AK4]|uniref:Type II toxin-antitoxin system ParD family antitoxin n=1 Tax=Caenispirillum salinarum AK4 TaxID=1238182 RepID=K9GXQ2_9PROT|nr:type II toxin-antitoxin system ParD family antitoxin [Caenispirillum salinarum]EKV30042.1 hypothetical protein C882_0123 [Caenispirillum salinarum AK4]